MAAYSLLLGFIVDSTMVEEEGFRSVTVELEFAWCSLDPNSVGNYVHEAENIVYDQFNPHYSEVCDVACVYIEVVDNDPTT